MPKSVLKRPTDFASQEISPDKVNPWKKVKFPEGGSARSDVQEKEKDSGEDEPPHISPWTLTFRHVPTQAEFVEYVRNSTY